MLDVDLGQIPNIAPGSGGAGGNGGSAAGGAGGATERCLGTPTSCNLLGPALCSLSVGCGVSGDCLGQSAFCFNQTTSYSCSALQGCVWSSSSKKCSGSAFSCSLFAGEPSCLSQSGCSWKDTCLGSPSPCSLFASWECSDQAGCYVGSK